MRSQPVEFLEFVEADLRYARAYYDSWKAKGADWFQQRFPEAISWIEWNPELFPKKYRRFRRAIIRRTYFGIFFAIEPSVTTVVAILDLRRDPKAIRRLLRGPVLNGNFGGVQSEAREWMGREHSIIIHLPPLATVAFNLER